MFVCMYRGVGMYRGTWQDMSNICLIVGAGCGAHTAFVLCPFQQCSSTPLTKLGGQHLQAEPPRSWLECIYISTDICYRCVCTSWWMHIMHCFLLGMLRCMCQGMSPPIELSVEMPEWKHWLLQWSPAPPVFWLHVFWVPPMLWQIGPGGSPWQLV